MAIKLPARNFFTFSELMARWECTENDLRFAIISGDVKPSIRVHGNYYGLTWEIDPNGRYYASEYLSSDYRRNDLLNRWMYLQDPCQIHPFDCEFKFAADDRDASKEPFDAPFSLWISLQVPMSIEQVKENAVFLLEEVAAYEAKHGTDSTSANANEKLASRERNSLLTIIAALCNYSGIKHQERGAATQIAKLTDEIGAPVTDDTIRKALNKIPDALETRMK